ncbi:MAG: pyridoxamine 5'-phosphate oxidase family protein [bacterium]
MELNQRRWGRIRDWFQNACHGSAGRGMKYVSIATVNEDGSPHVTPVGSLVLADDRQALYFEEFSRHMAGNLRRNQQVCVQVVNDGYGFWLKSLVLGRFTAPVGVRLMGTAGERRKATAEEIKRFHGMIGPLKWFKGCRMTWSKMNHVRELHFHAFEPIETGAWAQEQLQELTERP